MTEKHSPLLPCPFCGSSAHITEEDGLFFAGCDECFCAVGEAYDGCAMPRHCFFESEAAAKAWNTRAVNGLPEAIAALEAAEEYISVDTDMPAADAILAQVRAALTKLKG